MSVWADLVPALIAMLSAPLAAGVTYWATRKKREAEQQAAVAQGAYQSVQAMQTVVKDMQSQVDDLQTKNTHLQGEVSRLHRAVRVVDKLGLLPDD